MADDKPPLVGLISDILEVPDVLFVVKSSAAVAEIRGDSLDASYKNDWITVGDNDGPAHMHINMTGVSSVRFVREEKPKRTSYSVQLADDSCERILAAFYPIKKRGDRQGRHQGAGDGRLPEAGRRVRLYP